jgi:hypothetical protein
MILKIDISPFEFVIDVRRYEPFLPGTSTSPPEGGYYEYDILEVCSSLDNIIQEDIDRAYRDAAGV